MDTDIHPDGNGLMSTRIEEEMGDVMAAIEFVSRKLNLSDDIIEERMRMKLKRYNEWDTQNEKSFCN